MKTSAELKKTTKRKRKAAIKSEPLLYWNAFEEKGIPLSKMTALANDLVDGVKKERYYTIERFLAHHHIPYQTWKRWMKKFPIVKQGVLSAKNILYDKRVQMGYKKECSDRLLADMWRYSEMHREDVVWEKNLSSEKIKNLELQLKNQVAQGSSTITIELDGEKFTIDNPTCKEK